MWAIPMARAPSLGEIFLSSLSQAILRLSVPGFESQCTISFIPSAVVILFLFSPYHLGHLVGLGLVGHLLGHLVVSLSINVCLFSLPPLTVFMLV